MGLRWTSTKNRPVHLGFFPVEKLKRSAEPVGLDALAPPQRLGFERPEDPASLINAMGEYMGMLDAVRIGNVNPVKAVCPNDVRERANHLKAFGYFGDASLMGTTRLEASDLLPEPFRKKHDKSLESVRKKVRFLDCKNR